MFQNKTLYLQEYLKNNKEGNIVNADYNKNQTFLHIQNDDEKK